MTQLQVELQRDGRPLGWLPAGKLHALMEATFVTEQQFIIFRLDHRRRSLGATGTQKD
jgi:hypothetical protein